VEGQAVNTKRIRRLMREQGFVVQGNPRLKATRTPTRSKPRPTAPNQWWGMDRTTVMVEPAGWVYLVLVLDWYTKIIVGHSAGLRAKTTHWLTALDLAVSRQFPHGSRDHGLHLMSDHGGQPSSVAFMKAAATLGNTQAFTRYNNPKGNVDTERLMRTLTEERL
jgi:putative transposase